MRIWSAPDAPLSPGPGSAGHDQTESGDRTETYQTKRGGRPARTKAGRPADRRARADPFRPRTGSADGQRRLDHALLAHWPAHPSGSAEREARGIWSGGCLRTGEAIGNGIRAWVVRDVVA